MQIRIEKVSKSFAGADGASRAVLRDIDLACDPGSVTVLEGRSGSGKSTLLNLVAGLFLPDAGRIHVGDLALHELSESARDRFRAESVGYVFQTFNLLSPLTVLENLVLPGALAGDSSADRRERAAALIAELGLAEQAGQMPYQLSVGQRQRVAVARALLQRPRVLLADEPTANLDAVSSTAVTDALLRMQREGATLLIATHDEDLKRTTGAVRFDVERGGAS
ncbi:MAG: ABC transporter ATP-binding protein [Deltaproteobacteria bacterium]|jgi:putative ABC transport system ATP-binding protein|nr:ABC transporter ATP-binding protein [Deltaproteobacteria bacterium]